MQQARLKQLALESQYDNPCVRNHLRTHDNPIIASQAQLHASCSLLAALATSIAWQARWIILLETS